MGDKDLVEPCDERNQDLPNQYIEERNSVAEQCMGHPWQDITNDYYYFCFKNL